MSRFQRPHHQENISCAWSTSISNHTTTRRRCMSTARRLRSPDLEEVCSSRCIFHSPSSTWLMFGTKEHLVPRSSSPEAMISKTQVRLHAKSGAPETRNVSLTIISNLAPKVNVQSLQAYRPTQELQRAWPSNLEGLKMNRTSRLAHRPAMGKARS